MITRIGVIYEDAISLGFLQGLRDRLKCTAEFIAPTATIGRTPHLTRRTARRAWRYFQKQGVDLIVRFTDADMNRWQEVGRAEKEVFPREADSLFICGVAVNAVEDWLARDTDYAARVFELDPGQLERSGARIDHIKKALKRIKRPAESMSDTVARFVQDVPSSVFKTWLKDDALRRFYSECRDAAKRADCDVPNELDTGA